MLLESTPMSSLSISETLIFFKANEVDPSVTKGSNLPTTHQVGLPRQLC